MGVSFGCGFLSIPGRVGIFKSVEGLSSQVSLSWHVQQFAGASALLLGCEKSTYLFLVCVLS
jgi:hypothetical protein